MWFVCHEIVATNLVLCIFNIYLKVIRNVGFCDLLHFCRVMFCSAMVLSVRNVSPLESAAMPPHSQRELLRDKDPQENR